MKRQHLILLTLSALLVGMPMKSADAGNGFGHGHGRGHGGGFGVGGLLFDDSGIADLYRQLYNNLPYFALHPPVYYSYPVPRTYGYSPFAYPPGVMTPEFVGEPQPLEIINPHVPSGDKTPAQDVSDRSAAATPQPEPLVILNPFVPTNRSVARSGR